MKKDLFTFILIFVTTSLLFGQDLNYHISYLNDKYAINIEKNTTNVIINLWQTFNEKIIEFVTYE